jgi:hypothetical protein
VHFDIKKGRLVQILDENNTPIDMRNYWGACDGKDRYVFFVGLLNKLLPSDKSFCFYTPRKEAKNRRMLANSVTKALVFGLSSNTTVSNKPGIRIKEELLYLNMDNGQVSLEEWAGTEPYGKVIKSLNNGTY